MLAERLARLTTAAVDRCRLDLSGRTVLTEAATGAYAATAVVAAQAGAQVIAYGRDTRYGTLTEARDWTLEVADRASVADRIEVVDDLTPEVLGQADVVTNSGHLRPLDAERILQLKDSAVVPLMMEAWEIGVGRVDVDLDAMRRRGIAFAGTNEREPAVGVFDYLGVMAVKLLTDAGVAVHGTSLVVLCDNPFRPYLERTLAACGAQVTMLGSVEGLVQVEPADAVLVSLTPADGPRLDRDALQTLAERMPAAVVAQYFGDVDRTAAAELGLACWPEPAPTHGHMGVLPSAIGPEPVVRLQAGGLKVGEVLLRPAAERSAFDLGFLDVL